MLPEGPLPEPVGAQALVGGGTWQIADEVPVEIGLGGRPWTVTMASPCDVIDLALGLALTERALLSASDFVRARVSTFAEGIAVDLEVRDVEAARARLVRRTLDGVTGCGLCGVETLGDVALSGDCNVRQSPVSAATVAAAMRDLPRWQPLNARCHTLHVAAWCDADGGIALAREDLGRHNALDKVLGALARAGMDAGHGFVILSSRCSYELVRKCAARGVGLLATQSAPTAMALEFARRCGIRVLAADGAHLVEFEHG